MSLSCTKNRRKMPPSDMRMEAKWAKVTVSSLEFTVMIALLRKFYLVVRWGYHPTTVGGDALVAPQLSVLSPSLSGRCGYGGERRRWRMKRPGGRLAKGRISTGKEKGDHRVPFGYFATWNIAPYDCV